MARVTTTGGLLRHRRCGDWSLSIGGTRREALWAPERGRARGPGPRPTSSMGGRATLEHGGLRGNRGHSGYPGACGRLPAARLQQHSEAPPQGDPVARDEDLQVMLPDDLREHSSDSHCCSARRSGDGYRGPCSQAAPREDPKGQGRDPWVRVGASGGTAHNSLNSASSSLVFVERYDLQSRPWNSSGAMGGVGPPHPLCPITQTQ